MEHQIKILKTEAVTHDVVRLVTDKPKAYQFTPGQATEVAVDQEGWRDRKRPFTFTSLPQDTELAFTIKVYESHQGVTRKIGTLTQGDTLRIGDPWGAIAFKGPGVFLAGGAGITPFLSVFRNLHQKDELSGNRLIFANKTRKDIIQEDLLSGWLGEDFENILSQEKHPDYAHGYMDRQFLESRLTDPGDYVYLCGPPPMMESVQASLDDLGIPEGQIVQEALD